MTDGHVCGFLAVALLLLIHTHPGFLQGTLHELVVVTRYVLTRLKMPMHSTVWL